MTRVSRQRSKSSVYHVMCRGNEQKKIFLDDEDRTKYISVLMNKKQEQEYMLYAFCLMDNHIHLLLKEDQEPIDVIMKRINTSYACYFNKKYQRVGHVFQDRYKSEAVEQEGYLLTAARYIHLNPVKAKLVAEPSQYVWSSYNHYLHERNDLPQSLVEPDVILRIFSPDKTKAKLLFEEHTGLINPLQDLVILPKEERAQIVINNFVKTKNIKEVSTLFLDQAVRTELLRLLKEQAGLSGREIAAFLGIDRNLVQRSL